MNRRSFAQKEAMTIKEKKELARLLFMTGDLSQKEIAARVIVSERTMSIWTDKGKWNNLRQAKLITKEKLIGKIYNEIDNTLDKDDEEIVITEGGKPKIKKNRKADEVVKLAKSLSLIQNDRLMLPHVLQTFKMFNAFIEILPATTIAEIITELTDSKNIIKVLVRIEQLFLEQNSKNLMF